MNSFYKKESTWLESIIFSFFVHVLIILFLLTTPALLYLNELTTADSNEASIENNDRLLVDLEDSLTTEEIESFIISSNAAEGSGYLTPQSNTRTHLLGDFTPPSKGNSPNNPAETKTPIEKSPHTPSETTLKTPFEFSLTSQHKQTPPTPDNHNPSKQELPTAPHTLSGLESENTTNFRFHIDNNQLQQPKIAKDSNAALFLDIKNSLSYKMNLYANSPGGAGLINYHYLKVGEVSAIVTINQEGTMNFLKMVTTSDDQPYLNYLIEKIVTHEQAIQNLPNWFTSSTEDKIYLEIALSYKGPPLYQWWVSMELLSPPPD